MNRCVATTKRGERCKNSSKIGKLCHIHAEKGKEVKPKKVKAKEVKPKEVKPKEVKPKDVKPRDVVFNPYYNKYTDVDGLENCGNKRSSLKRFGQGASNIAFADSYCDVLPLKDIKYIVGPVVYSEFRYDKYSIGLFGEKHHILAVPKELNNKSTVNFSSFLASVVTQNPKQFDFFLEMYFRSRKYAPRGVDSSNTIFNLLAMDFHRCLEISKDCPYKNLRAHYADYRSVSDVDDNIAVHLYQNIAEWFTSNRNQNVSTYLNIPETEDLIENALKYYREILKKVNEIIKTDKKLGRQLDNTPLKIEILQFSRMRRKKNLEKFKEYLETHKMQEYNLLTLTTPQMLVLINFAVLFINVYSNIMDIYILARMFRTFSKTPAEDPENIIVYAGDSHTDFYNEFFEYINATKIIEIRREAKNQYIEFSEENKRKSFLF